MRRRSSPQSEGPQLDPSWVPPWRGLEVVLHWTGLRGVRGLVTRKSFGGGAAVTLSGADIRGGSIR